ncbi:MAG: hypothetical protein D6813_03840, partial [Calditrichaeota bacterium]
MKTSLHKVFLLILQFLFVPILLYSQEIQVGKIDFKGNKKFSDGRLRKIIETKSNPWYNIFF